MLQIILNIWYVFFCFVLFLFPVVVDKVSTPPAAAHIHTHSGAQHACCVDTESIWCLFYYWSEEQQDVCCLIHAEYAIHYWTAQTESQQLEKGNGRFSHLLFLHKTLSKTTKTVTQKKKTNPGFHYDWKQHFQFPWPLTFDLCFLYFVTMVCFYYYVQWWMLLLLKLMQRDMIHIHLQSFRAACDAGNMVAVWWASLI